jgi:hypothetical protein
MAGNGKYNRFRKKDGGRKSVTPKSSEVYGDQGEETGLGK